MSQRCPTLVSKSMTERVIPNPCTVVRDNSHPGQGTVLVLGTPRGGTSVVAGICHLLGVSMGADIDRSNVEDRAFQQVLMSRDIAHSAGAYFTEAARRAPIVGVKNPIIIDHLASFYSAIPHPILVVVSRDVYATAQREEVSGNDFFLSLRSVIGRKYAILDFVETVPDPLLVVSYERLLAEPAATVTALSEFMLGRVDATLVRRAASLVHPHADMPNDVDFIAERIAVDQVGLRDQPAVT